jgi:hypothetical protein
MEDLRIGCSMLFHRDPADPAIRVRQECGVQPDLIFIAGFHLTLHAG